jgi:drug/metabolite transporter (DMT)-like permease
MLQFRNQLLMFFFAALMLLASAFAWAMYQNLLKDKFDHNAWKFTTFFAKCLLWVTIAALILMFSPNGIKRVQVRGSDQSFVLCESTTPGSRPVRSDAVSAVSKKSS